VRSSLIYCYLCRNRRPEPRRGTNLGGGQAPFNEGLTERAVGLAPGKVSVPLNKGYMASYCHLRHNRYEKTS